jgi:hypothetical protein
LESDEFRVASQGYRKNIEFFRHFKCKYTIESCEANSLNAIYEDKEITRTGKILYGTWTVKGNLERLFVTPDPNLLPHAAPPSISKSMTTNFISDGKYLLDVGLSFPVAKFNKLTGNDRVDDNGTPVSYGIIRRGRDLDALGELNLRNEWFAQFVGQQNVFGNSTLTFKTGRSSEEISRLLHIDPLRGFWPINAYYYSDESKDLVCSAIVTSLIEHKKGYWFPQRTVLIVNPTKPANRPYSFREIRVTSFDISSGIEEMDLSIVVPAGYQMQLQKNDWAQITPEKNMVFSASRLSELLVKFEESEKNWKEIVQHQPKNGGMLGSRTLTLVIGAVLGALILAFFLARRRRRIAREA